MSATPPRNLANFIWQVADLLRGDYKRADYGKVIPPFTVLRRLECVLEDTRDDVLAEMKKWEAKGMDPAPFLPKKSGYSFYNVTSHSLTAIAAAPDDAAKNLMRYVIKLGNSFSDDQPEGKRFDYMLSKPPFGKPRRSQATWVNHRTKPLRYAVDSKQYSPTGLVHRIWASAGWEDAPVFVQGTSRWHVPGEGSLVELAESVLRAEERPVEGAQ